MEILQIIFSGIVTLSTIVYAILTWKLVKETRMMREFQLKPDIRIYFERGEIETNYVYLVLENKGFGTALNVNFIFLSNLSSYSDDYFDVKNKGVFKNGVAAFYPNQKFNYYLLNVNKENHTKVNNETIKIEASYEDITKRKIKTTFDLSIAETSGIGKITPPNTYVGRIPFFLENINKSIKKINDTIEDLVIVQKKNIQ
ncbi:hypothetical protein AX016_2595 [Cellulophaga sp. RHA19]|uniref:hypothetical protein n=1 Tax=Cellulophaga sp. RHA19 TaxID=1798237 RepID=UPI000C2C57C2|nr:hypothetical protein [Cellulophaga sp. RHA19]PKB44376.1 hypothetical protein AX016_2595 [Cellulophaga sp. RHA19]